MRTERDNSDLASWYDPNDIAAAYYDCILRYAIFGDYERVIVNDSIAGIIIDAAANDLGMIHAKMLMTWYVMRVIGHVDKYLPYAGVDSWGPVHDRCKICSTREKPHAKRGFCVSCFARRQYASRKFRELYKYIYDGGFR